jgi:hypothetical protein
MVRAAKNSEHVTLSLHQHHETPGDGAYLVSNDGDRKNAVWVPKSMCERGEKQGASIYEFTMEERIAIDKGLV